MKIYDVDWKSIVSASPASELVKLQEYCKIASDRCGNEIAIEIGSYEGGSAALLSEWFETVICIDPWGDEAPRYDPGEIASFVGKPGTTEHMQNFMKNVDKLGIFGRVLPIVGTSDVLGRLPYLGAALIFVDDGHVYNACKLDIDRSVPHLAHGGLLVCHDYKRGYPSDNPNFADMYKGVQLAVDEAINTYSMRIVDHFEGIVALEIS